MKIFKRKQPSHPRGYIALLSVVVLGIVGVSIMLSVILSGITALKTDLALQQSSQVRSAASSCGEEALEKILETGTTTSSGNLTLGSSTCSYAITSQNGQNIKINATGMQGTLMSKVQILIATTSPSIVLSSWQEVGDF
jgi:hypothetical protein